MDEKYTVMDEGMTGGEEQSLEISSDLIRGHINTIILRCLYEGDKYGYDIINEIEKKSGGLYVLKQPTLYSALKRLESLRYVTSYYGDFSNGGRRKYFSLTDLGREVTEKNLAEWEYSRTIIDSLISDGEAHYDFSFITDKQRELDDLKKTLTSREQAMEDERTALNSLRNELQRERLLLSAQSSSLASQKSDFTDLRDKVEAQTRELSDKESSLNEKQAEIDTKALLLEEKAQEIADAKSQLAQQQALIEELRSRLELQQTAFIDVEHKLNETQEWCNKQTEELLTTQNELTRLQNKYDALQSQAQELATNQASSEELEEAYAQIANLRNEIDEKKAIISSLNAAISTQENTIALLRKDLEDKSTDYYNKNIEIRAQLAQIETQREKNETEKHSLEAKQQELAEMESKLLEQQKAFEALEERTLTLNQKEEEFANAKALWEEEKISLSSLSYDRQAFEDERSNLQNQLETLQVERDTLRNENEVLENKRAELEEEKARLDNIRANLVAEREQLDKKTYELTQLEYSLENKQRNVESQQTQISACNEEAQRQIYDLEARESELQRQSRKLQEDVTLLQQQQKELSARQNVYNQQQLEFIARKNAQASLQFELAERESTINAQSRALNESRERLEAEKISLEEQRKQLLKENENLKKATESLEVERAAFNAEKQAQASSEDVASLQRRYNELQEYEHKLMQRETLLNERFRGTQFSPYGYPSESYGACSAYSQQNLESTRSLRETATQDGITVYSTGKTENLSNETNVPAHKKGTVTYNVGATLFKTAFIIFCIVAFESLSVFFGLDYLKVSSAYPFVGFGLGFAAFMICTILYVGKYKPNARLKKSASYISTCVIMFVIAVIMVTMVAVYFNAQLSKPSQLLAYVIIPTAYLLNIILFAVFYRTLSKRSAKK